LNGERVDGGAIVQIQPNARFEAADDPLKG
jgi:hypothetical protein